MGYTLVANAAGAGLNGGTAGPINPSGSNLFVIYNSWFNGVTADGVMDDTEHNTWTPLTKQSFSNVNTQFFYCFNPIINSSHSFSFSGSILAGSICVEAWSGSNGYDSLQNSATSLSGTTIQPGASGTPSVTNSLIVTGMGIQNSGLPSIDSGFVISNSIEYVSGNNEGGSLAYLIDSNSQNPTWTIANTTGAVSSIAVFAAAGGGGGAGLIKTINGLAFASVKTRNGLAMSSVKTVNGLAAQ